MGDTLYPSRRNSSFRNPLERRAEGTYTRNHFHPREIPYSRMNAPHSDSTNCPRKRFLLLCAPMAAMVALTSCETPGQTALAGAAAGAAIGGALHGRGEDALKGAAIGAGAGYLAGRAVQHERNRAYREGYYDSRYRDDHYDRRLYTDRYGDRYYIGGDGRRYYVD